MAVLFPFELDFYKKAEVPVCLVRHPLLDDIDTTYNNTTDIAEKVTTIGLVPGSRNNEVKKLLPVMIKAGHQLFTQNNKIRFILPVAPGVNIDELKSYNKYSLPITYQENDFYGSIAQCQALAIASGTATLQTALMGKAMVVIYKISPITYKLFGHLVNVEHICLANIILNKRAYTELVQEKANANNLFKSLNKLIKDKNIHQQMQENRDKIYKKLDSGMSSEDLAKRALMLINDY